VKLPDGTLQKRTGDRSWRNNNPGNIEYGPFAKSMGAAGSDGRFATFADAKAGRKAQEKLIFETDAYKNKPLTDAISKYAPAGENNTAAYQKRVLDSVGGKNLPMSQYTPDQRRKILDAMGKVEGGRAGTVESVDAQATATPQPTPREAREKRLQEISDAARSNVAEQQKSAREAYVDAKTPEKKQGILEKLQKSRTETQDSAMSDYRSVASGEPQAVPIQSARVQQKAIPQPEPLQAPAPAPIQANVPEMSQLAAAMQQNNSQGQGKQENPTPVVRTEFDDTLLTLMAYDRV
jgi:hypothetical protein